MEVILIVNALAGTLVTVPSSAPTPPRGLGVRPLPRVFIYAMCLSEQYTVHYTAQYTVIVYTVMIIKLIPNMKWIDVSNKVKHRI